MGRLRDFGAFDRPEYTSTGLLSGLGRTGPRHFRADAVEWNRGALFRDPERLNNYDARRKPLLLHKAVSWARSNLKWALLIAFILTPCVIVAVVIGAVCASGHCRDGRAAPYSGALSSSTQMAPEPSAAQYPQYGPTLPPPTPRPPPPSSEPPMPSRRPRRPRRPPPAVSPPPTPGPPPSQPPVTHEVLPSASLPPEPPPVYPLYPTMQPPAVPPPTYLSSSSTPPPPPTSYPPKPISPTAPLPPSLLSGAPGPLEAAAKPLLQLREWSPYRSDEQPPYTLLASHPLVRSLQDLLEPSDDGRESPSGSQQPPTAQQSQQEQQQEPEEELRIKVDPTGFLRE